MSKFDPLLGRPRTEDKKAIKEAVEQAVDTTFHPIGRGGAGGSAPFVQSVVAGTNVTVDDTDPQNPIVSATGGGASDWGDLGGTLSDQTDLQTALDAKADDSAVVHDTGNETIAGVKTLSNELLAADGSATNPSLSFSGDTDTGFYRSTTILNLTTSGVRRFFFDGNGMSANSGVGARIDSGGSSGTVPNIIIDRSDTTTGIGSSAAGTISLIAGGSTQAAISSTGVTIQDAKFFIFDDVDNTKIGRFNVSGLGTGATRTLSFPNQNGTIVLNDNTATLSNKTIDADSNTLSNIEVADMKASAIVTEAEGLASSDNDTSLPTTAAVKDYVDDSVAAGLADGDKGDITVSGTGATWTIDNGVVTYAKMQDISATSRILGRITTGAGDTEELTAANVRTIINVEDGADVTDATNVAAAGAVMEADTSTASMSFVVDEDDMVSDSATKVPSQQSVKAYVDTEIGDLPELTAADPTEIDLDTSGGTTTLTVLSPIARLASPTFTGTPAAPTAAAATNTTQIATTAHVFAERTNSATLTNKTLTSPVINTPTGIVKGDVGLGNVDNTSNATERAASATLTNKTIALGSNTISGTTAQFNTANTDGDFATLAGTEVLLNKTVEDANFLIRDDSDNTKIGKFSTSAIATGTTRTLTFPDANGLIITATGAFTLTNKKLADSTSAVVNVSDETKALAWSLGGATTGKTVTIISSHTDNRSITIPDKTDTLATLHLEFNAQTGTTYTPVLADDGKMVTLSNAGAITLTLPQDSDVAFPVGTQIHFVQLGAGQVTATNGTGATVNGTPTLKTRAQYSTVTAVKRAANTWLLMGDLATS